MVEERKGFDFDDILEEIAKRKLSKAAILSKVNLADYETIKNIIECGATFSQKQWEEMIEGKEHGDFQYHLAQDGKNKGKLAHAAGLKSGHADIVKTGKDEDNAHAYKEF